MNSINLFDLSFFVADMHMTSSLQQHDEFLVADFIFVSSKNKNGNFSNTKILSGSKNSIPFVSNLDFSCWTANRLPKIAFHSFNPDPDQDPAHVIMITENKDLFGEVVRPEERLDWLDTQPLLAVGPPLTQLPALTQSLRPDPNQFLFVHFTYFWVSLFRQFFTPFVQT